MSFDHLPEGTAGLTNGQHIWLAKGMQQTERRCVMTHELVHIDLGHYRCQTPASELAVRVETARKLISFEALTSALKWSNHPGELAEDLWVTEEVLIDRIEYLTTAERRALTMTFEEAS